jgi:uncharacterized phage-associated protein
MDGNGAAPMQLKFRFNLDKTVQTIAYILQRVGTTDKVKLTKLLYLADRSHFIRHGYPITGDDQYAMKKGPVPSLTLDALDGDYPGTAERLFPFIHIDDYRVSLNPGKSPGTNLLSDAERQTLDEIIATHGGKDKWELVNETHLLPEYVQTYVEGTSTRIPYERIASVCGDPDRFRLNRTVISLEAAAHMDCPYPSGEGL